MGTGSSAHRSRRCRRVSPPRPRSKETVVARRARTQRQTLEVRITFEPSHVSPGCVAQAYEGVVPITRRPTPLRSTPAMQAGHARQQQPVGRRETA